MRRVRSADGVELAVTEAGDPSGSAVVLIHGYPDTKEMWGRVIERLGGRLHVVAYDVRGAGQSSRPRGNAAYDLEQLGDDLLAVADAIAPGRRIHLVGHDWGGLQGWEFATQPRFDGRLASFTAIAAPSLDHVAIGGEELLRSGRLIEWFGRARRSWYILLLLTPGLPTVIWRLLWSPRRWRRALRDLERIPVDDHDPAPTLGPDGVHGAKLYRRNIPRRALRPRRDAFARVPVQLIVPTRDRFISEGYYELAERFCPDLRRQSVDCGHWAPRAEPGVIAGMIESFVEEVEPA